MFHKRWKGITIASTPDKSLQHYFNLFMHILSSFVQCQVDLIWPMQWPFLYAFELQKPSVLKCWYWCDCWAEYGLASCLHEKAFRTNTCTEKDWNIAECLEIHKTERSGAKWTWQKFRYCTLCIACVLARDRIVIWVLAWTETCELGRGCWLHSHWSEVPFCQEDLSEFIWVSAGWNQLYSI